MLLSTPALILLIGNMALLWLLLAAPLGRRTIRFRKVFQEKPARIWEMVHPLGRDALWYPAMIDSQQEPGTGRVVQRFAHSDRKGNPISRTLEIEPVSGPWALGYEARVVEDSALDPVFWKNFLERRMVAETSDGAELIVEQTDRYRGVAFMLFRFFALRRELNAADHWLKHGKVGTSGVFEHPVTQILLALFSTLALWPFFGLSMQGLILSSMLTVVIALHELGHLAAYRSFGHKKVRMIFIPFLGGVAIGSRPYNSRFEVAACALMGAGLSGFFVPVLTMAYTAAMAGALPPEYAGHALLFLLVLGAFNLLNLLPMSRFDGGQVLRQVFPTEDGLLGGSFLVTAGILWTGWWIGIAVQVLLGALAVMALLSLTGKGGVKPREELEDMTGGERLFAGFGYYAALAIHAYALIYACEHLFK